MNRPVFRFRLERVRALREQNEQLARQELAQAIASRSISEADLRVAEAELDQAHSEQRATVGREQSFDAAELVARQAFLERVEAQRGAHARELERREAAVAERGAKLTAAATDHETLKRLSERQRIEHERAAATREQGVLDEIAATHAHRSGA